MDKLSVLYLYLVHALIHDSYPWSIHGLSMVFAVSEAVAESRHDA